MPITSVNYKKRIEYHLPQIIELWCICKYSYCQKIHIDEIEEWRDELRYHICNLKYLNITGGKTRREMLEQTILQELHYDDLEVITSMMKEKFITNDCTNTALQITTCTQFADRVSNLIDLISDDNRSDYAFLDDTIGKSQ